MQRIALITLLFLTVSPIIALGRSADVGALEPEATGQDFVLNVGLSGAWYNPQTPGQGLLIEVIPETGELFVGWFTFNDQPGLALGAEEHRWLTAQGPYSGSRAELVLYNTTGGVFNSDTLPTTEAVGEALLSFTDCGNARLTFDLDGGLNGTIPLVRLTPGGICDVVSSIQELPTYFWLRADAEGVGENGLTAVCHIELIYELSEIRRLPGLIEYAGVSGGEVARSILDETGAGFAFSADFFVPDTTARVIHPNELVLVGPGVSVNDSRLYLNLAQFIGKLDGAGSAQGEWSCGPFDVDVGGYVDTEVTVTGQWHIEAISDDAAKSRLSELGAR
jgi:hypothetical protein